MKTISTATIMILLNITCTFSQKYTELHPTENKEPIILITGKNITYYHLNKHNPIEFSIENADKVVIYSRKRIDEKDKPEPYEITYNFDDLNEIIYKSEKIQHDQNAVYTNKSIIKYPSNYYKKVIDVPENAKIFKILLNQSNNEVDVNIIAYYDKDKKKIKPIKANDSIVIKTGKIHKYYKLNSLIKTDIKISGPGKLIVYTRKRISENNKKGYSFSYVDIYANKKTIKVDEPKISAESIYRSYNIENLPSIYSKTVIDIAGKNETITFLSDNPVDARFVFLKDEKKTVWEDIPPINKNEKVPLQYKESKKIFNYYRISEHQLFSFNVTGPKNIRLTVRGEFLYDMHSNNDYALILRENSKIINTYKLSGFRSVKIDYKDNDEKIPGTLDVIYVSIPAGKHSYTLGVGNKNKTALVRISVPSK